MEKFKVYPNRSFSNLKIEINSPKSISVIVCVQDAAGNVVKLFYWGLSVGMNVTSVYGLDKIFTGKYKVGILDKNCQQLYATALIKNLPAKAVQ